MTQWSAADPRVAKIGDKYRYVGTTAATGEAIGIAWTDDFETFHQLGFPFLPYNRKQGFCFRKIEGRFACCRVRRHGSHALQGDIFYSERLPDMWVLGPPPSCDVSLGVRGFGVAVHEDRRGPRSHRDLGGLAAVLPRDYNAHCNALYLPSSCWIWRSRGRSRPAAVPI